MADPMPLPIRILVKGPSTTFWLPERNPTRDMLAFPRALEQVLLASGRPAEVRVISLGGDWVQHALASWDREVLAWSPDVIINLTGHHEQLHYIVPRWLERHANSLTGRPTRIREAYRARLVRPIYMALARFQARIDGRYGLFLFNRQTHVRTATNLRRYIERVRTANKPLFLQFEFNHIVGPKAAWFQDFKRRNDAVNREIAAVIDSFDDPEIRLFPLPAIIERDHPDEDPMPDGFHFTVKLHGIIARELYDIITEWADKQPHLTLTPEPIPPINRDAS